MALPADLARRLADVLGADAVDASEAARLAYATDSSRQSFVPDVVVWPAAEAQVAQVVRLANELKVCVYARGRGTATTGASLAERGGIVLATERMAAIGPLDLASRCVTVEPGVLNGDLAKELAAHRMQWPPDPSSAGYSSVGGNLATAAAGPRGIKYGGVRENVLALRAVLGDGSVVHAGAAVPKSSVGYDLARLLVGSEGRLAIITQATLRLVPLPATRLAALAQFRNSSDALGAVTALLASPALPSAVEFIDEEGVKLVDPGREQLAAAAGALLLLETDGPDPAAAAAEMARVREQVEIEGCISFAQGDADEGLWRARKVLSQKLRELGRHKINEDVVVPVGRQAELVAKIQARCAADGLDCVVFGHAGAGNLHVNVIYESDRLQDAAAAATNFLMELCVKLGGSISGEHGVGIAKRAFVELQLEEGTRAFAAKLKRAFDPNGILNPDP